MRRHARNRRSAAAGRVYAHRFMPANELLNRRPRLGLHLRHCGVGRRPGARALNQQVRYANGVAEKGRSPLQPCPWPARAPLPTCVAAAPLARTTPRLSVAPRLCRIFASLLLLIYQGLRSCAFNEMGWASHFGFQESCATVKPAIRGVTYGLLCVKYPLCVQARFLLRG